MQENRNSALGAASDGRGTVCIDTNKVFDTCRDRDCFEDARVYLTSDGEDIVASASSVRTKSAKILCAFVGLDEVPFNCGFYQVKIKYYVGLELEACLGLGRSQCFKGLSTLEKDVILYGGEGNITSFSSGQNTGFCGCCNVGSITTNAPTAIVDTVEPIVLNTRIGDCNCNCCCECYDVPDVVNNVFGDEIVVNSNGPRLLASFGIFSVIRLVRPSQLLVQGVDYSVPDKECNATNSNEDPCEMFRGMAFPIARFQARCTNGNQTLCTDESDHGGGCGCSRNRNK